MVERSLYTGTYRPPFGPIGGVVDRVAGHRVAEVAVYRFVKDVAARLQRELAARHEPEPTAHGKG